MSLETLLSSLSDGKFHSGDELGSSLGVSRTAIWKQLKKVEELGIAMTSTKGKGYCIEGGLDLLIDKDIRVSLSAEANGLIKEIEVFGVVDSTNINAMEKAQKGEKGYVCTAEKQTAGRGRRGRNWASPYASNIYLSAVWEFDSGASSLEGLSLAVGVAVVDALAKAGIADVELKWPNDVLHKGRKLAGILLEVTGDAEGPCQVVVGIGLNVKMPEAASADINQPWVDVDSLTDSSLTRSYLLALLLNELMPLLELFGAKGFSAFRERWQDLDAYAGMEVVLMYGQETITGVAESVDSSGAIVLRTPTGVQSFNGGEVSLRPVSC
jgi:BirA family biotin operon repressor/biotin-[acetyl-CoA-carboxylase] ligase